MRFDIPITLPDLGGEGNCKTTPNPDIFFSDNPTDLTKAHDLCNTCPVIEACKKAGETEPHGYWGGTRSITTNSGTKRKDIQHGSSGGTRAHKRRGEDPCTECKNAIKRINATNHANRQAAKDVN